MLLNSNSSIELYEESSMELSTQTIEQFGNSLYPFLPFSSTAFSE